MNLTDKPTALQSPETQITELLSALLMENSDFSNKVFSVGGFVRDQILKIESNDLDLVIEIPDGAKKFSEYIHEQFQTETTAAFQKGLGYPIWHLSFIANVTYKNKLYLTQNGAVDFADSQKECFPDPTTRQRITTYGNLFEDIRRRDFTINMLAQNLTTLEIIDLSGCGLTDLNSGLIQTHPHNNPDQIFADDPLRMIRAVRFAVKYNFKIHNDIQISIQKNAGRIQILSHERIWDELKKIISNAGLRQALKIMIDLQLFPQIFEIDPNLIDFKDFNLKPTEPVINLIVLFSQLNHSQIKSELDQLKIEKITKNNVLMTLSGLIELDKSFSDWQPFQMRGFARNYFDQLDYIHFFRSDYIQKIQSTIKIPLQKSPLLKGNDIVNIFNAQGAEIKTILNRAMELEDQYILILNVEPSNKELQAKVLELLTIEFKK